MQVDNKNIETRVLVLMPTGRDASLVCVALNNSQINAQICIDAKDLEEKSSAGAGAILLAEEALRNGILEILVESFDKHPIWSDIPVVIFAANTRNAEKLLEIVGTRLNATIVERPIRITMLVSAVLGALRARARQYQTRDLLTRLEEADEQKDLFLATLSHELRTPLNSMLGWINILRNNRNSEEDFNQALDVIERNAKSQAELVADILFISRVITGKLELKMETVYLSTTIQSAINTIRPTIEEKNIELHILLDDEYDQIKGDAERLQQVFLNLLSNALKFTPENGRIEIHTRGKDSNVEIEIRDSGQGIKPEFLPYVFERFRQADSSYTRTFGGLGLGLAIVQHLVELHNGSIKAESDGDNTGATFTISLPLPTKEASNTFTSSGELSQTDLSQDSEQVLEGIHILLVEDDEDSREMLEVVFAQYDIKTTAVEDAAEALNAITQIQADILISDVGLPGENGYELMRKIRKLAPDRGGKIPAIALTGYASLKDKNLAINAGFQNHLCKPVDIDELLELIKNLLQ